ncbi:MAG: aminopeptidase, partial [Pseudomonadales bacterium]
MPCAVLNTVKTAIPAVARWAAGLTVVVCLIGCDSLGYYAHLTGGQWNLVRARQSVERILADRATDAELKQHLLVAQNVVAFAESDLGLSAHGSYRQYVHLDRSFVVWNVFAAEPWSLEGFEWCYPFVGCAPYRGFFSRRGATQAAAELA